MTGAGGLAFGIRLLFAATTNSRSLASRSSLVMTIHGYGKRNLWSMTGSLGKE